RRRPGLPPGPRGFPRVVPPAPGPGHGHPGPHDGCRGHRAARPDPAARPALARGGGRAHRAPAGARPAVRGARQRLDGGGRRRPRPARRQRGRRRRDGRRGPLPDVADGGEHRGDRRRAAPRGRADRAMRGVQAGDPAVADRPPLGVRVVHGSRREPDWLTMSYAELLAYREAENRARASRLARPVTGFPDRGAAIEWQEVALPGGRVPVRVYRPAGGRVPAPGGRLPLVLHVHGGGFVGTAAQSDWVNSHLAARLPAVVVSVEHRLLDHRTPLAAALDDGWDVLELAVRGGGARWRVDAERVAVLGESTGGLIAGLMVLR